MQSCFQIPVACVSALKGTPMEKGKKKSLHRNVDVVEVEDPFCMDGLKKNACMVFLFCLFFSISLFLREYMKTLKCRKFGRDVSLPQKCDGSSSAHLAVH